MRLDEKLTQCARESCRRGPDITEVPQSQLSLASHKRRWPAPLQTHLFAKMLRTVPLQTPAEQLKPGIRMTGLPCPSTSTVKEDIFRCSAKSVVASNIGINNDRGMILFSCLHSHAEAPLCPPVLKERQIRAVIGIGARSRC